MMVEILYILLSCIAAVSLTYEFSRRITSKRIPFFLKLSILLWIVTVISFGVDSCYKLYNNIYNIMLLDNIIVISTLLSVFFTLIGGWQYAKLHNDNNLRSLILQKGIPFLLFLIILKVFFYLDQIKSYILN